MRTRRLRRAMKKLKPTRRDGLMVCIGILVAFLGVKIISMTNNAQTPLPYQSTGITAQWIPSTVLHWSGTIDAMSKRYNIDPNVVAIIMTMESGGNASARSSAGAVGLMQVTSPTARDIAAKYLKRPVTNYDLTNPTTNIEFGVAYLTHLRDVFGAANQGPDWNSTVELIAAGYNGGPGAAASLAAGTGLTDIQTVSYSRDAFNMWRERHANDSPTFDRWKARGGDTLLSEAAVNQTT